MSNVDREIPARIFQRFLDSAERHEWGCRGTMNVLLQTAYHMGSETYHAFVETGDDCPELLNTLTHLADAIDALEDRGGEE